MHCARGKNIQHRCDMHDINIFLIDRRWPIGSDRLIYYIDCDDEDGLLFEFHYYLL
jgi:hypothetical protein